MNPNLKIYSSLRSIRKYMRKLKLTQSNTPNAVKSLFISISKLLHVGSVKKLNLHFFFSKLELQFSCFYLKRKWNAIKSNPAIVKLDILSFCLENWDTKKLRMLSHSWKLRYKESWSTFFVDILSTKVFHAMKFRLLLQSSTFTSLPFSPSP